MALTVVSRLRQAGRSLDNGLVPLSPSSLVSPPQSPAGVPPGGVSLWRVTLIIVVAIQLIALYSPSGVGGPQISGLDKVVHVLIFATPALVALMAGFSAPWALGILALHAPVSELVQHFLLSRRDGDVIDVMADIGGVVVGGLVFLVWSRRQDC